MMRSVLLAETAKARKRDATAILEARGHLEIIRKKVVRHGLTPGLQAQREAKQKELLKLERPSLSFEALHSGPRPCCTPSASTYPSAMVISSHEHIIIKSAWDEKQHASVPSLAATRPPPCQWQCHYATHSIYPSPHAQKSALCSRQDQPRPRLLTQCCC